MSDSSYDAVFLAEPEARDRLLKVYGEGRRERIEAILDVCPEIVGSDNLDRLADVLRQVRYAFSSWGTPRFEADQLQRLPKLEALFYAAGSVQYFARQFLANGVKVSSAFEAIALPVAAFTAAQIVLASKGYFPATRACRSHAGRLGGKPDYPGLAPVTVAILGAGTIGTLVIKDLKRFPYRLIVFDPFLGAARAEELGVERVSLEEAFARGFIVTNHIANLPATVGMLRGGHFSAMPHNATFINTGRGATLVEQEMLDVLERRGDLTALLDVTWPEPPLPESRAFSLPNVLLSPHIAGSQGQEILLQADYAIAEFERYRAGEPLRFGVTEKMLETMA
jgi:phosphoglycerate dehydrogenase-like enzyme